MRRAVHLHVVLVAALAAAGLGACSTGTGDPVPADGGTTTGVETLPLPARWWIWADEFAPDENPIADPTGDMCALHQPDDVWFLAGTYGGPARRACVVPEGRPVFFPVLNLICAVPPGSSTAAADQACRSEPDALAATLDGEALEVEEQSSGVFSFTARSGTATGLDPGPNDAIAWGYWVGPLEIGAGEHVLRFAGSSGAFELEVTYDLTVE